jgi:hypothetical protein
MNLSSWMNSQVRGRAGTFVAVAAIAGLAGTGAAVAAGAITSAQIKDGTIQTGDLTKNNFAKFTSTENVVSATTPVSTVPAYAGARVVEVAANSTTPVVTLVLDKGTWKLNGTAQFWHIGAGSPAAPDYGVVTIPGLQDGFGKAWTADVPDGDNNAAQVSFNGTIKITTNDTPVVISGSFTGGNAGQAGVSVQATQYEYVKLFHGGH